LLPDDSATGLLLRSSHIVPRLTHGTIRLTDASFWNRYISLSPAHPAARRLRPPPLWTPIRPSRTIWPTCIDNRGTPRHLRRSHPLAETIRKAFVLKLKPGALDDYIYWHDNIWPELQQEIARQGIAEISLFQLEDMIFLHSRVNDPEAWTRLWDSDVHRRWGELMSPLMHYRHDGIIDSRELREIWHFTPETTGTASDR
jgi:L-rhamnose mutarotase